MKITVTPKPLNDYVTITHFEWDGLELGGYNPETGILRPICRLWAGDIIVRTLPTPTVDTNDPLWTDDAALCRQLAISAGYTPEVS